MRSLVHHEYLKLWVHVHHEYLKLWVHVHHEYLKLWVHLIEDITVTVLLPPGSPGETVQFVSEGELKQSLNHNP